MVEDFFGTKNPEYIALQDDIDKAHFTTGWTTALQENHTGKVLKPLYKPVMKMTSLGLVVTYEYDIPTPEQAKEDLLLWCKYQKIYC